MAYEQTGKTISLISVADNTEMRYAPVTIAKTADSSFDIAAAAGTVHGVLQDGVRAGQAGTIMISGVTFCKASAAIAAGSNVVAAANGTITTAVADATTAFGVALTAATAVGDIISVLLV